MGTIRDLNELTVPVSNDYVLVADTSDLVDKDKKMQLSHLAIKSGTPTAGHVATWLDANTVQDGGTVLTDKYLKNNVFMVDATFTNSASAQRFTTLGAALAACSGGETILIAPGTYTESVNVSQNNISIIGSGRPYWDGTNLVGGTLMIGQINVNTKLGIRIRDLGLDIRAGGAVDAIPSGAAGTAGGHGDYQNIACVGKGSLVSGNQGHGILCTSGPNNVVRNCRFYNWYHGIALRCSDSIVSDCYFWACNSDSVIIKGDVGSGSALRNTITNCVMDGNPADPYARSGPMRVQNFDASTITRYVTISNITATNTGEAVVLIQQLAGSCSNVMVSNVVGYNGGDASIRADFDVLTATDVHFTGCMSANRANGYGFRSTGTRVRALNCSSDASGAGRVNNLAGWDYLDLGSGIGTDILRTQNVIFERMVGTSVAVRDAATFCNTKALSSGVATPALTCVWIGNGSFTSLIVVIHVNYTSGSMARLYSYRIVIYRNGGTALVAALESIGTSPLNTTGAGNSMTVTVDVATANTAIVTFTGVTGAGSCTYLAEVLSLTTSSWNITP